MSTTPTRILISDLSRHDLLAASELPITVKRRTLRKEAAWPKPHLDRKPKVTRPQAAKSQGRRINSVSMTNGVSTTLAWPEDVDALLAAGWWRGRHWTAGRKPFKAG